MGESAPRLEGRVLGGTYQIVRQIGAGGIGAVYEAQSVRLGKRTAVKVLTGLSHADQTTAQRFRREAKIATDLGHPHIVDVILLAEDD